MTYHYHTNHKVLLGDLHTPWKVPTITGAKTTVRSSG